VPQDLRTCRCFVVHQLHCSLESLVNMVQWRGKGDIVELAKRALFDFLHNFGLQSQQRFCEARTAVMLSTICCRGCTTKGINASHLKRKRCLLAPILHSKALDTFIRQLMRRLHAAHQVCFGVAKCARGEDPANSTRVEAQHQEPVYLVSYRMASQDSQCGRSSRDRHFCPSVCMPSGTPGNKQR
jgi:hypothetical protein